MLVVALGLAALVILVLVGRYTPRLAFNRKLIPAGFAVLAAVAALAAGLRGAWLISLFLIGLSAWLGRGAAGGRPAGVAVPASGMTAAEARAILGIGPEAGPADVDAAYRRLMLRAHPDHGGSSGLAAQLNAAREALIKKK